MQHLNEEQLVLHRYQDDEVDAAAAEQHLNACAECRAHYDTLCRVLQLVDELPVPERGDDYGTEVWNRLRWRLGRRDRARVWQAFAAAAMIAFVFFAGGLWWARRNASPSTKSLANGSTTVAGFGNPAATTEPRHDRILLVVVSDHLDSTERMLLELSNADASRGLDVTAERRRATELVSANRLYRQTARQRGDERIAAVLQDIEPVLVELAHADDRLSPTELASLQKRIDSKELLFKVRIVSAQASGREAPTTPLPKGTNSL
jgi:hypothetical protein